MDVLGPMRIPAARAVSAVPTHVADRQVVDPLGGTRRGCTAMAMGCADRVAVPLESIHTDSHSTDPSVMRLALTRGVVIMPPVVRSSCRAGAHPTSSR